MKNILVSWVGKTDVDASRGEDRKGGKGPIASAVSEIDFDVVRLLCTYAQAEIDDVTNWIKANAKGSPSVGIKKVSLDSPMNYGDVYQASTKIVEEVLREYGPSLELTFHTSPGTFAMQLTWVLIALSRHPAKLISSSKEAGVQYVNLPFEISAEYVGNLVRESSRRLSLLADGLPPAEPHFSDIIHRSRQMKELIKRASNIAVYDVPVLIVGESGTGKELFARAIHKSSLRKDCPFLTLNCGAIPSALAESTLFGHKKGSFTDAVEDKAGYFEAANGGTLFLDEIGELEPETQVKLLRAIQNKMIHRLGETKERPIDIRLLSATNRDLVHDVARGNFREDLFFRLAVHILQVPPLREREGDAGLLIDHFVGLHNKALFPYREKPKILCAGARSALLKHRWPGNVRELENTVLRILTWSDKEEITEADVRSNLINIDIDTKETDILSRSLGPGFNIDSLLDEVQKQYFIKALEQAGGNKSKASKLLGFKSPQAFSLRLKKFTLE